MYNRQLDTFIQVADVGSFNKAAEKLYISANAVMKQINLLEDNLGFKLFYRTHRGLQLTPAGKSLYKDAKYMIQFSRDAIYRAESQAQRNQKALRIGISFTTPVEYIVSLWSKAQQIQPTLKFELVSFENTIENAKEIMSHFGQNIDMVAGIYSKNLLHERKCQAFHLYDAPICLAAPLTHPYANKDKITISEILQENLMMMRQGYLNDFDIIRADLMRQNPNIQIKDISFLCVNVFNECVNENKVMLAINEWKNIHPMMKMIPIEWSYTIPMGILYSLTPSMEMKAFLSTLDKLQPKG